MDLIHVARERAGVTDGHLEQSTASKDEVRLGTYKEHAVVDEVGQASQDGCFLSARWTVRGATRSFKQLFLPAALRRSRDEHTDGFADEGALHPQTTGGIPQSFDLRRHSTESCREAKQDTIAVHQGVFHADAVVSSLADGNGRD